MNKIQLISAPSILGLRPTGVEQLPRAILDTEHLRNHTFLKPAIEIDDLNDSYSTERDQDTGCLNTQSVLQYSRRLMDAVIREMASRDFLLVLGGDCSILIGIMAALKSLGTYGLVFVDGHADFYLSNQSVTGEIADMDLAIVVGRGPAQLTNINSLKPYVAEKHVVQVGQRDQAETAAYGSQDILDSDIKVFGLELIQAVGISSVLSSMKNHLASLPMDGFWIHFDTDVLEDDENPAVDYRLKGGISFRDMEHVLKELCELPGVAGMSMTIFNPTLDPSGEIANKLGSLLNKAVFQERTR